MADAVQAWLQRVAGLVASQRFTEAAAAYDDKLAEMVPGTGRLAPEQEQLRRAVTDLISASDLRPQAAETWSRIGAVLATGESHPLRAHLAAVGQRSLGDLQDLLSMIKSIAPDTWPVVEPCIPSSWSPPRRAIEPTTAWLLTAVLLLGVLGLVFAVAWLQ